MRTSAKTLLLFFIIYADHSGAQVANLPGKTTLNSFIEKPTVEWAAYANDTATLPAFSTELLTKFLAGKIKGMALAEQGTAAESKPKYLTPKELENILLPADTVLVHDTDGVERVEVMVHDAKTELPEIFRKSVVEFYQTLYVENGKLKSYISRISPKTEVYTSSGLYLGRREPVSFCLNTKYNAVAGKNDKLVSLGKFTKSIYADSLSSYDMVKVLYGKNLIAALWSAVFAGKISVYLPNEKDRITAAQLISGDYPGAENISVPVYDSLGNLTAGTRILRPEFNTRSFERVDITEELWYDETLNIVICKIPELIMFKKRYYSTEDFVPAFRLVF